MKKLLFIVLDGAADLPIPELNGGTPLSVARKPNLDNLARNGTNGLMKVLPIPPESDEAVLSLLGFDVFKVYTGRGPIEADGAGVEFSDGQLALRCNFATADGDKLLDVRAGNISTPEAKDLEKAIVEFVTLTGASFEFRNTVSYRGVLVINSDEKVSPKITNTHPAYSTQFFETIWSRYGDSVSVPISSAELVQKSMVNKCQPLENTREAITAARLVNEFIEKSRIVLEKHPVNLRRAAKGLPMANIILTRDAGTKLPALYDFKQVYQNLWACIADMPIERGIAELSGMTVIPVPESTSNIAKDLNDRVNILLRNITFYDSFYIHLKGPDIFSHKGDPMGKIDSIEKIDQYFFKPLLENIDLRNTIIVVTCDHTTSSKQKAHTDNPVPITISGADIMPDQTFSFSETECAKGSLKYINAINLMPTLMKKVRY